MHLGQVFGLYLDEIEHSQSEEYISSLAWDACGNYLASIDGYGRISVFHERAQDFSLSSSPHDQYKSNQHSRKSTDQQHIRLALDGAYWSASGDRWLQNPGQNLVSWVPVSTPRYKFLLRAKGCMVEILRVRIPHHQRRHHHYQRSRSSTELDPFTLNSTTSPTSSPSSDRSSSSLLLSPENEDLLRPSRSRSLDSAVESPHHLHVQTKKMWNISSMDPTARSASSSAANMPIIHSLEANATGHVFLSAHAKAIHWFRTDMISDEGTIMISRASGTPAISSAAFHPSQESIFAYGDDQSRAYLVDTRHSADVDTSTLCTGQLEGTLCGPTTVKFGPQHMFIARDLLTERLYDIRRADTPLYVDYITPQLHSSIVASIDAGQYFYPGPMPVGLLGLDRLFSITGSFYGTLSCRAYGPMVGGSPSPNTPQHPHTHTHHRHSTPGISGNHPHTPPMGMRNPRVSAVIAATPDHHQHGHQQPQHTLSTTSLSSSSSSSASFSAPSALSSPRARARSVSSGEVEETYENRHYLCFFDQLYQHNASVSKGYGGRIGFRSRPVMRSNMPLEAPVRALAVRPDRNSFVAGIGPSICVLDI